MVPIVSKKRIQAPIEVVFKTIADIENFSKAVPRIVKVEFLSEKKSGVGTKFRETRRMGNKEHATDLEVTEYEENKHIRIISDTQGTLWDSVFTVEQIDNEVELTLVMHAKTNKLSSKILNFLIKRMIAKELDKDMEDVKRYCE